jgi:hypothetical protein
MPKVPLTGQTVNMLSDGYVGKILDEALSTVVRDLLDRGHDGKARNITLKLVFSSPAEGMVEIGAEATIKLPNMKPPKTLAKFDSLAGGLMFNPEVAGSPDQKTFSDAEAE